MRDVGVAEGEAAYIVNNLMYRAIHGSAVGATYTQGREGIKRGGTRLDAAPIMWGCVSDYLITLAPR